MVVGLSSQNHCNRVSPCGCAVVKVLLHLLGLGCLCCRRHKHNLYKVCTAAPVPPNHDEISTVDPTLFSSKQQYVPGELPDADLAEDDYTEATTLKYSSTILNWRPSVAHGMLLEEYRRTRHVSCASSLPSASLATSSCE